MKITFCCQTTGCGNNGGTASIFHSAEVLSNLGHQVNVVSDKKNLFNWFKLKGAKFIKATGIDYPDADVLIATGVGSVKNVLTAPPQKGFKSWWIRAHETWITGEPVLYSLYRRADIDKMVNSRGLRKFISRTVETSLTLVRPGLDFDVFYQSRKERDWNKKTFTLGALYNSKGSKRFKWIPYICERLKTLDIAFKLKLYGTVDDPVGNYDEYISRPTAKELRKLYNEVDFWIAPTKAEGLHIPPQEAMLCGCIVIGASGELNGMNDYIEQGRTGFLVQDADKVVELLTSSIANNGTGLDKISKAGIERIKSMGDREQNMGYMVEHFIKMLDRMNREKRDRVRMRGR